MTAYEYEGVSKSDADAQTIVVPIFLGFVFGFLYSKAAVYLPTAQFAQWSLQSHLFVKFVLAAVIASLLCGSLMSLSSKNRFHYSRNSGTNNALAVTIGALVAGVGMTTAGSTTASSFVQVGGGVWSGLYVIIGGLLAVVIYGYLYENLFSKIAESGRRSNTSLDEALKVEYSYIAVPIAIILTFVCCWLEYGRSWSEELPSGVSTGNSSFLPRLKMSAWNPYLCGGLVGLLQLPLRFTIGTSLSTTYAFISPVAVTLKVVHDLLNTTVPRWFHYRSRTGGLWSLIFCVAAALGCLCAAQIGGTFEAQHGFGIRWCLLSGFLLVLGSLIMGYCPLGVSVSGCSDLNLACLFGTLIMMSTAVGVAQFFSHEDIHPEATSYQSVTW